MLNIYQTGIDSSRHNYTNTVVLSNYQNGKFNRMRNNLEKIRKLRGLTRLELANILGTTETTIYRKERGERQLRTEELQSYSEALKCRPEDLLVSSDNTTVPVLGYVGAGEEVHPIDDLPLTNGLSEHQKLQMNCEFVEAPPGGLYRDMIALKVKGESMEPFLFDGNYVYYNEIIRSGFDTYLNKRVVCQLRDGRLFLKVLKKSPNYGKYNLLSYNPYSKAIEDIELEWCAKVVFTKVD